eukprot:Nk52_evm6s262 gene=Nk52_evmTU6s262
MGPQDDGSSNVPESRQSVQRRTFGDFLGELNGKASSSSGGARLVIPLFQRRYCWNEQLAKGWIRDVLAGKRDHFGVHNSGKVIVKGFKGDLLVIDGQQRLTTESLLLAAIRDRALKEQPKEDHKLVNDIEKVLYVQNPNCSDWEQFFTAINTNFKEGVDYGFSLLVPSFGDRKSFLYCITKGRTKKFDSKEEGISAQAKNKNIFDEQIELHLKNIRPENRMAELEKIATLALNRMGITLVDIQNDINLTQVFLWLQEKTLFSEGALVYNPNPGVDFACGDLVRNLVMSCVMDKSIVEQEEFHQRMWLDPIESQFPLGDTEQLAVALREFLNSHQVTHVSALEELALGFREKFSRGVSAQVDHLLTYAKIYSMYEERLRQASMLPPVVRSRKWKGQGANAEEPEFSNGIVQRVSMELLEELGEFIKRQYA